MVEDTNVGAAASTPALAGLRVVEVGDRTGVGACGGLLAQLGADVVLLVPRRHPRDDKWGHEKAVRDGKRVILLDESDPGDRRRLAALIEAADVVLLSSDRTSFATPSWDGPRRAGQVVCDITAFGHQGPLAGVPASDALVQACTGTVETTGPRDGPPSVVGAPVLEMESAVYAASAVVAALYERCRSGRGQRVDVAIYDVGVNALLAFLALPFTGRAATRDGNRHLALAPWNAYRASDGWVQICSPTDDMWARLCAVMERPEMAADPRFASPSQRLQNVDAVDEVVAAWVHGRTVQSCVDILTASVIPVSEILGRDNVGEEPNLLHRGMVRRVEDTAAGMSRLLPGSPLGASARPHVSNAVPLDPLDPLVAIGAEQAELVTDDHPRSGRPLDGIRVVEIGMNTVAPLAGRQLASLGADVIKVEPPAGDSNRLNGPLREDGESYVFALSNTDKRGVVLDLKCADDRERLWALLSTADALIENLKPGSLGRLGFGSDDVRRRLPDLVYCSINGFGHDSVYPNRPALDTVIQAMSGLMGVTLLDGVPYKAGISVSDQIGGQLGLLGVTAALLRRRRAGGGATLDLAMQDGTAWVAHPVWNAASIPARMSFANDRWHVTDHSGTTPVLTVAEVLDHPHTKARGLLLDVPTVDGDTWTVLQTPFRLGDTPVGVRSAMPRLGFIDDELERELEATHDHGERHHA